VKVLIEKPKRNRLYNQKDLAYLRRFSRGVLHSQDFNNRFKATPSTHETVLELGPGDAPAAEFCIEKGWPPENITCLDRAVSPTPLVEGVKRVYADLNRIGQLLEKGEMPEDLNMMPHSYDIVFATHIHGSRLTPRRKELVAKFFLRDGGLLISW
jgi:hypothetical protein